MSAKKRKQPQDHEYHANHIMRSAWEDGTASLPGLTPIKPANKVDDIAADLALTGEIPLDLIREILRRQKDEAAARRAAQSASAAGMITPDDIVPRNEKSVTKSPAEFARETPTRVEIEAAKQQLRAMKAMSALPQEPVKAKMKKSKQVQIKTARTPQFNWNPAAESEALYQIPLREILVATYRSFYYFGLRFARPILRFGRFSKPFLLHPVMALGHMLRAILLLLHHVTIGRAQRAFAYAREHRDYRRIFRSAINTAVPTAAFLILLLVIQSVTIGGIRGQTYALRVTFDGTHIGYAINEQEFERARAAANEHMQPLVNNGNGNGNGNGVGIQALAVEENLQVFPQFELVRVSPEQLTPAEVLTDRLLEHSPHEMASGNGVFVDGYLIATIRNSSDAQSVLNSIITEQTVALDLDVRTTDTVEFIQDINIVPGFYPANQMIDAQQMMQVLNHEDDSMLEVKVVRTETRRAPVAYGTIDTNNYQLFQGEMRVRVRGTPGEDEIVERVTYINGMRVGTPEEISRHRVREPQPQRREIGRRSTRVTLPDGSSTNINPSTSGFIWPVPSVRVISSRFGMRNGRMHNGIDIANGRANGAIVVAARAGTVTRVAWHNSWGNYILIDHGGGIQTRYAHLLSGSTSVVRGQRVEIGQPIARVGSTGNSTGPHLHFEVIVNGRPQNPLNFVSPGN